MTSTKEPHPTDQGTTMRMPAQHNSPAPSAYPSRRISTTTSPEPSNQFVLPPTQNPPNQTKPTTNITPLTCRNERLSFLTTNLTFQTQPTPQLQNEALYDYARSIVRATPKREHEHKRDRPPKNAELEDDSLALLLSWGGGEKVEIESVADVMGDADDDVSGREGDGLKEDGGLGGDVGSRTWESPQLGRILAVLVIFVLMVSLLLLWQGVLSILASVRRE